MNDIERYNFWHCEMDEYIKQHESRKKYSQEIDEAVKRVRDGKFIPHDQVIEEMKKW